MKIAKIRHVVTLLLFLFTAFASAQSFRWSIQAPYPTSATVYGAYMLPNSLLAWMVTGSGSILHSQNGGTSWSYQKSPTNQQLRDVEFANSSNGIAIGNDKVYTTDGGANWIRSAESQTGTLYDLSVVDASTAFACGGSGIVVKTSDGGASWVRVGSPSDENLTGIDFVSPLVGWVVGASGVVYRTDNGGSTWTALSNTPVPYGRVSFINASEGWAAALGKLVHTTDGGLTWTLQPTAPNADIIDLFFRTSTQGWTSGYTSSITSTSDGGASWLRQLGGNYNDPFYYAPLHRISFADSQLGITAGLNGIIFSTNNGGATWVNRQSGSWSRVNNLFALNTQKAWAASDNGELLYTEDGGRFWNRVSTGAGAFTDIKMAADGLVGFASSGTLWKTIDGGRTWWDLSRPTDLIVSRFDTLDFQTIFAVGYYQGSAAVSKSTDGGLTWNTKYLGNYGMPGTISRDIQMVSPTQAYLVVNYFIGKTTNGGNTWSKVFTDPSGFSIARVSFADANNGWAANTYGVLHTSNGGATWVQQTPAANGDQGPNAVFAVSPSVAYVADYQGALSRTSDGGQTWVRETIPNGIAPLSLYFVNANIGWLGGQITIDPNNAPMPNILKRSASVSVAPVQPGIASDVRQVR